MKTKIEAILNKIFRPVYLEVNDDSQLHAGHLEALQSGGTHFSVVIVSDQFKEMPLVKRHRAIYQALENELKAGLHALAIKAYTTQEFAELR